MQLLTPLPPTPAESLPLAAAALQQLSTLDVLFTDELKSLPKASAATIETLGGQDDTAKEAEVAALLKQLNDFWQAPSAKGQSRAVLFAKSMEQALRNEVIVKNHERNLGKEYTACLPLPMVGKQIGRDLEMFALHVQLNDKTTTEIAGALVFISTTGLTLLVLPGIGTEGFKSRTAFSGTLVQWLNSDVLRHALFNNTQQRDQQLLETITRDPDLDLEPFTAADLQLHPITGNPFAYALERQLDKQRKDVRHACLDAQTPGSKKPRIDAAMGMPGLFGPGAMLALREMAYWERQQRRNQPHWIKIASDNDLKQYQQRLTHYEQSRTALLSALGGAASHEQCARMQLRARIASDLGYDLEPEQVMITMQRRLAITGKLYTTRRSLLHLALYGLHPGDRDANSAFQTLSTIRLGDSLLEMSHPLLTLAYVAELVDELSLGTAFREYQRTAYAAEHNQQLMRDLTRKQVSALAYAAKMQAHITAEDFAIIEQIEADTTGQSTPNLHVQQIRLDDGEILGRMLVFRKNDSQGRLERLIMFAADAPRTQHFQAFDNQTQLTHELVSWTTSPDMSGYLLKQVPTSSRENLETRFAALRLKPHPPANYVQLITRSHYNQALGQFVRQHVRVAAADQAQRVPDWYMRASPAEQQELLALEDALAGATENFHAEPPTQAQDFEEYVHQRASKKISELLGVAEGSVDPDQIIITSQREVLSYTQMLRNGHDDTLGFLSSSADTEATFSGPPHVDLKPLNAQKVGRSVHGKWLSDDYIKLVRDTLLDPDSPGYDHRRRSSLQITVLQMKAAALRSYLKGQLDTRQYQWLRLYMDHLHQTDSQARRRYPLHTLQLRMENPLIGTDIAKAGEVARDLYNAISPDRVALTQVETVQGCYLLSSADASQPAMLYTPQAPDGLEFRLLSAFKNSLSSAGMIDYYKDRCRIDARRKLAFFLRDMEQGGASKPPVIPRDAVNEFQDICFNRPLERQLRDVEDSTTGRSDMLARLAWITFEMVATVVTLPFPPASFAVGALLSLHDSMKALQAFADGDRETASAYILSSLFNSLGAAGDLSAGMKGFGALRQLDNSAKHASAFPAAKNITRAPSQADLHPVNLEGETFWRSKPNANGHASVYRLDVDPSKAPQPTGQFARHDLDGKWRPLSEPAGQPAVLNGSAIKPDFSVNISLENTPPLPSGHAKGVSVVNGKYYIELGTRIFEVQFDASARYWNIIDPQNPFAFFGKRPVRLDAQGKWHLLERPNLRGGMDDSFKPLATESVTTREITAAVVPYELPLRLRAHFDVLAHPGRSIDDLGLGLDDYFEAVFRDVRADFARLREKLYVNANAALVSTIPLPRPVLPLLEVNADAGSLIKKVFQNSNAMVIGEAPRSIASKRLLIENMAALAEQDVKVLYIQHLFTDLHMYKLDKYRKLGARSKTGSSELRLWFETLNDGALKNRSRDFDYYHVVKIAHRHGIEVRPLSSSVSYPLIHNPVTSAAGDIAADQKMSNFFSNLLIGADAAATPQKRWVALVDQRLANTHQQVPGIAELQGAISVRVHDVPDGRPTLISRDLENTSSAFGKADFKIEVANPLIRDQGTAEVASAISPPSLLDEALHRQIHGITDDKIDNIFVGKAGFEWKETGGWQPIDAENWPAEVSPTAIQFSLLDTVYGMPVETRASLHDLINFKHKGLDSRFFLTNDEHSLIRDSFFNLRRKLQKDARKVIAHELPERPTVPSVSPGISHGDLLEDLYQHTDGVVIGESHSSIASKKLIIDNLPLLARQDVKTLYMEHLLSDLHQADLDRYFETGYMSKSLLHDLRKLDLGHQTDPDTVYTFEQLVIKARANGLEIRAIDCAASYHIKEIDHPSLTTRQQMFSYFASRTLRKHQEVMGAHKWIALVGNSHANTYEKIIPGLAELEGGIGIRVVDVRPGQGRGVSIDPGDSIPIGLTGRKSVIKSDLRLEMETLKPAVAVRPPQSLPIGERLTRPGMFLIEESRDGLPVIVHRSRDNAIHRTPVKVNAQGQVYVERATWATVNLKPFADMDALIVGLEEINLTRVA
ncbi:membrane-targeted effector domain-containing toxin [Pseudomonas sp. Irchel 3A5]|uniref:membrane-targeted effector domain-containing toxin n=1 Tax=Pseudomonas sp. Irchel 3A5 TaxID=2008911 RepID=UPI000BA34CBC|nr:membrane-targeted effector domain-containing toxin [Pseudomonas sp. Irchel 3A5]